MNAESYEPRSLDTQQEILVDEATRQFVIVHCGKDYFALEGHFIREILPNVPVTFMPGVPEHFLGIIHVRGQLESVADLGRTLHADTTRHSSLNRVVIARHEDLSAGLFVEYVHDIVDIPERLITSDVKVSDPVHGEFFIGELTWEDRVVIIVDVPKLLLRLNGVKK